MKVVIFAGGFGTRISEESHLKPKPMIEIGGKPILWHIMKIYSAAGFNDFIVCLGYKGYVIKEYFLNYFVHNCDLTINLSNNQLEIHSSVSESMKVTLVDTGLHTQTAGRLKRIQSYLDGDEFCLTYGDGVADINVNDVYRYHKENGKLCTMTAVIPEGRFGTMDINEENLVTNFKEKPKQDNHWINAGFFVMNKKIFDYLEGDMDNVMWEQEPIQALTNASELIVYKHKGFWACMDAMRDKIVLEEMWNTGSAKWKVW